MRKNIDIYTDGGCSGNPGAGGWAFVIYTDGGIIQQSGTEKSTTNNRMELKAVIEALKYTDNEKWEGRSVALHTDSQYVKKGITEWIKNWIKNGWLNAQKQPVKNRELWAQLKSLSDTRRIEWNWVKGHADNEGNVLCDTLVQKAIRSLV